MCLRLIRSGLYLLLGLMLGASVTLAHAGYALPAPPQGFAITAQGFMYRAPASLAAANGAFHTGVSVNVAGKAVQVPAAMRLAANAPSFVVNAVKSRIPWAAVGAVALWAVTESMSWDDDLQQWVTVGATGGATYHVFISSQGGLSCLSIQEACSKEQVWNSVALHLSQGAPYSFGASWSGPNGFNSTDEHIELFWAGTYSVISARGRGQVCPDGTGWSSAAAQCVSLNPVPVPESYWDGLRTGSMPDAVATQAAREIALPVDAPELGTVAEPLSKPYIDPVTGQPWQDMVRITPAPTPESPFRVRVDPYRQPMTSADPDAVPLDQTQPGAPGNEALPQDQQSICKEFPNISACQELGDPGEFELPEQDAAIPTITPESIGSGGSCPADKQVSLHGGAITFSWLMMCSFATGIRPVVLAMAWLIAGTGFFYAARRAG